MAKRAGRKLRVAIIGCGRVAVGHAGGWLDCGRPVEVVALADIQIEHAQQLKEKKNLSSARVTADWRELLGDDAIDAVDIATPSHLHAEQIMAALDAGKHVVTEKPTGYDLEECRKLRYYARNHVDRKVAVAYSLRYYPTNIAAKAIIDAGDIGHPMYASIAHNHAGDMSRRSERPRGGGGGGLNADLGGRYIAGSDMVHATHPFDFARYIMGDVADVFAFRQPYGTFATFRHVNGSCSQVIGGSASKLGQAVPHVLCVQGTEGTLVTYNEMPVKAGLPVAYRGHVIRKGKLKEFTPVSRDTFHGDVGRCRNFYDAIFKGTPLICDLLDGIRTSELLHAMRDSQEHEIRVPVHQRTKTG